MYYSPKYITIYGKLLEHPQEYVSSKTLRSTVRLKISIAQFKRYYGTDRPYDIQDVEARDRVAEYAADNLRSGDFVVIEGVIDDVPRETSGKSYKLVKAYSIQKVETANSCVSFPG